MSVFLHQLSFEQRIFWRNRGAAFFTFALPLLFLVFFASIDTSASRDEYRGFLLPGMAAVAIVSATFQGLAIALVFHREQGVLKRLRATPASAMQLLGSRIVSMAFVAVLEVALIVALGAAAYGIDFPIDAALFIVVCAFGAACFSALGVALAAFITSADAAPALANAVYLPMMFISGVFYEVDGLPRFVEVVAQVLPLYHLVELARGSYLGSGEAEIVNAVALGAWGLAGLAYAVRRFMWQPYAER